uniref:Uncharacterized protein n=1 Tax=Zea mays TaxID=4577 RepID=C0PD55_MAIZE|nr:unknown [Zea mays]
MLSRRARRPPTVTHVSECHRTPPLRRSRNLRSATAARLLAATPPLRRSRTTRLCCCRRRQCRAPGAPRCARAPPRSGHWNRVGAERQKARAGGGR